MQLYYHRRGFETNYMEFFFVVGIFWWIAVARFLLELVRVGERYVKRLRRVYERVFFCVQDVI